MTETAVGKNKKYLDLEQTLNVTLKTESHLTERNRETINVK